MSFEFHNLCDECTKIFGRNKDEIYLWEFAHHNPFKDEYKSIGISRSRHPSLDVLDDAIKDARKLGFTVVKRRIMVGPYTPERRFGTAT